MLTWLLLWAAANAGSLTGAVYWRWRSQSPYRFGPAWCDVNSAHRRAAEAERGTVSHAFWHGRHYAVYHVHKRTKLRELLRGAIKR